jgi:hypothetical protein
MDLQRAQIMKIEIAIETEVVDSQTHRDLIKGSWKV